VPNLLYEGKSILNYNDGVFLSLLSHNGNTWIEEGKLTSQYAATWHRIHENGDIELLEL